MKCSYCGNELKPGVNFCNKCGKAVVIEEQNNSGVVSGTSEQEGHASRRKWIVLVGLLSVVIIVLLIVIVVITNSNSQKNSNNQNKDSFSYSETMEKNIRNSTELEEVDADIDAVNNQLAIVEGIIMKNDNTYRLQLDDATTIYAYNKDGEKQIIDTEELFFNQNGNTNYGDHYYWRVELEGTITISDNRAYISITELKPIVFLGVQKETESTVSEEKDEYVFADSSSRYLKKEEVQNLSDYKLMIARNEIYARHGRKFNDSELRAYFNSKSWYVPSIEPDDFKEEFLNDYEKKNIELIKSFE